MRISLRCYLRSLPPCRIVNTPAILSRMVNVRMIHHRHHISLLNNNQISIRFCSSSSSSSSSPESLPSPLDNETKIKDIDTLIQPGQDLAAQFSDEWGNIGEEITGRKLLKEEIIPLLNKFLQRPTVRQLAAENGLKPKLLIEAFSSFRKKILDSKILDPEIHIILSDILHGKGHVDDLFPSFIKHAKTIYPHIDCLDDLKKISDLRLPPNWYPQARTMNRKFQFHCGPTNSGKTYNALNRFFESKSGIYCGPLKMLAVEVYQKANNAGVACDLITGEERRFADENQSPSSHVSCTVEMSSLNQTYDVAIIDEIQMVRDPVEMSSLNQKYEVAIIDEIQMVRDPERGWAWTRALLGIAAEEIHLCGEKAALNLIIEILSTTGEIVQVHEYKRLTDLNIEDNALESLENVQPGDCIVCFSKRDIYNVSLKLERMGHNVATIYGTLPPATKLLQCSKYNDPNDPCNVLVATDAIGMG
ncbi:ATP-dependent RNA helicase SUV3-like protein, mitochondrial-like, partial [Euroglyphus maynei]